MSLKSLEKLAPKARKAQDAVSRTIKDKNKLVMKQAVKTFKAIEMAKPTSTSEPGDGAGTTSTAHGQNGAMPGSAVSSR
jgi:hypothetical protein